MFCAVTLTYPKCGISQNFGAYILVAHDWELRVFTTEFFNWRISAGLHLYHGSTIQYGIIYNTVRYYLQYSTVLFYIYILHIY